MTAHKSTETHRRQLAHTEPALDEGAWAGWNAWCDSRIEAKQSELRNFLLSVVSESVGQVIAGERKAAKHDLEESIRSLRLELAEAQNVIDELRNVLTVERKKTTRPLSLVSSCKN